MIKKILWVDFKSLAEYLHLTPKYLEHIAHSQHRFIKRKELKQGIKTRNIIMPFANYKSLLQLIDKRLKTYKMPKCFFGSTHGLSAIDCAKVHISNEYILKLDLKSYYNNIHYSKIASVFGNFSDDEYTVKILTRLCTCNYCLPQGFPTSPSLAEMVLLPLYERLSKFCRFHDLNLSIYIDDICLSGGKKLCDLKEKVIPIFKQAGFLLNFDKLGFASNKEGIVVTGVLLINNKPTTTPRFDDDLAQLINMFYNEESPQIFDMDFSKILKLKIRGKYNWLNQIDPEKAAEFNDKVLPILSN